MKMNTNAGSDTVYAGFYRKKPILEIDGPIHMLLLESADPDTALAEFEKHRDRLNCSILCTLPVVEQTDLINALYEAGTDIDRLGLLLMALDAVNGKNEPDDDWDEEDAGYISTPEDITDSAYLIIHAIKSLADSVLITKEGQPNFTNMKRLRVHYGFQIRAGEQDSFGWLSGVIHLKSGKLVYG